ncbi:hypothetical protein HQ585_04455 [candidate division KSB1 bacterium]|nr:hypothetical protein [candidate division KSB1 bacterium]
MKLMSHIVILLLIGCLVVPSVMGQSLEERLEELAGDIGTGYLQPLADAVGANLNSGLYHTAKVKKGGLHFYVGIDGVGALISEDQRVFTAVNDLGEEYENVPTIFGRDEDETITFNGADVNLKGFNLKMFPIVAPRLTIGNIMGTELMLRVVELNIGADFGKFSMQGYGIRHSISQYFPLSPIDMSFTLFVQDIKIGDIVSISTHYFGIQASKKFLALELYGGVGIEGASLKAEYTLGEEFQSFPNETVSFSLDSKNRTRLNVGVTFHLLLLKIHADYNLASQKTFVVGAGIGL